MSHVPTTKSGRSAAGRLYRVLIFAAACWLAFLVVRGEVARWYVAYIKEQIVAGVEVGELAGLMEQGLRWNNENVDLLGLRAMLRASEQELEAALIDYDRAIELDPDRIEWRYRRPLLLQRLGRHAEAIRDYDHVVQVTEQQYQRHPKEPAAKSAFVAALNARAYARALGQVDIQKGLEDIKRAFSIRDSEYDEAMLDTRGYLYFLAGDYDRALKDLQLAVKLAEATYSLYLESANQARDTSSTHIMEDGIRQRKETLAVLYYHRGEIFQALQKPELAQQDLARGLEYGYDPENGVW